MCDIVLCQLFKVDEECYEGFRIAVHALGTLDALISLAAVAKLPGYVRPCYTPSTSFEGIGSSADEPGAEKSDTKSGGQGVGMNAIVLRGARHPTVERVLEGGFVPNDVDLRWVNCRVGVRGGEKDALLLHALYGSYLTCVFSRVRLYAVELN